MGSSRNKINNRFWVAAGVVFLGLAGVGIFLPVLPTTPFLLLAAACFGRGSPRLYHWLIEHPWAGSYIRNYRDGLGMPLRHKIATVLLLWLTIGATMSWQAEKAWLVLLLFAIAVGVSTHLLRIRTRPAEPVSGAEKKQKPDINREAA